MAGRYRKAIKAAPCNGAGINPVAADRHLRARASIEYSKDRTANLHAAHASIHTRENKEIDGVAHFGEKTVSVKKYLSLSSPPPLCPFGRLEFLILVVHTAACVGDLCDVTYDTLIHYPTDNEIKKKLPLLNSCVDYLNWISRRRPYTLQFYGRRNNCYLREIRSFIC